MLRVVKIGSVLVGTGVFVGLGVVGVLYSHRGEVPSVSAKPGLMSLSTPTPAVPESAAPGLRVASPETVASNGGGTQMLLPGGSGSGSTVGSDNPTPRATPAAEELSQYQKYVSNNTSMFGDFSVGDGAAVAAGSIVTVNYRGWLTNGKMFDESYSSGHTFSFKEGDHRVIAGWEEGLFGMKAGGKRRLIVPPSRGYGSAEHNGIPANSVLVFDVELVSVQ